MNRNLLRVQKLQRPMQKDHRGMWYHDATDDIEYFHNYMICLAKTIIV